MRKGVGLITWRIKRAFEPAHTAVGIAFRQQITANVVVGISQRLIDADRLQTFFDRLIVAILKAINPTEKGMGLGGRISFDRSLVQLNGLFKVFGKLRLVGFLEELL